MHRRLQFSVRLFDVRYLLTRCWSGDWKFDVIHYSR